MSTSSNALLEAALSYAARGWRVTPCHTVQNGRCSCSEGANCDSAGKHPRPSAWQKAATIDEEVILGWWKRWPLSNVGIVWGPDSGVIDIEYDTEEGRRNADAILGDCFTPSYSSGRSVHRIFRWQEGLPAKAVGHVAGIEIRTGAGKRGAQSIMPPSAHRSGKQYAWLPGLSPDDVDVMDIPTAMLEVICGNAAASRAALPAGVLPENVLPGESMQIGRDADDWLRIARGVGEGERNESAAAFIGRALADLRDPFAADSVARLFELFEAWNGRNRPPLEPAELQTTFKSILRRHREQTTKESYQEAFEKYVDTDPDTGRAADAPWKLIIVESKPKTYRLYSPLWTHKAEEGFITIGTRQYKSAEAIREEALEQAGVWIEPDFKKLWNGTRKDKGLAAQLIDAAESEIAQNESHRDRTIAELLWDELAKARVIDEGGEPDRLGRPSKMQDGTILFRFTRVWEPMARGDDRVKRTELSDVMKRLGISDLQFRSRYKGPVRLKEAKPEAVNNLRRFIGIE